ncbi:MAG: hypothetical protein JWO58_2 [Chitinophagaceae bacterium]|nr:hypothetical protein [Chitinophagaceae bacterium]
MKEYWNNRLIFFLIIAIPYFSVAQTIKLKGKIIDGETGEGMPFASIYIKNTDIGVSSDFEGFYTLTVSHQHDSLTVFNMGYGMKVKAIPKGVEEAVLNFQLESEVSAVDEIVVRPTENPAFAIMRKVIKNKDQNDISRLDAYEYETYNRLEVSVDNISDKLKKRKIYKKIAEVYDSAQAVAGEDGKPVIPMFISESISNYYHRRNPDMTKEWIHGARVTGVGVEDGSVVSQLVGTSFQNYNFYKNSVSVVQKDFLSPIADSWQVFYDYELEDSMFIGSQWCYKLTFKPKQSKDLAFTGAMWIHDTTFAIKQIDVKVGKDANINFIEKVKIQQEFEQVAAGAWIPVKTRALLDIEEITKNSPGLLAKFYSSSKDIKINQPKDEKFYDQLVEVESDANVQSADYWEQKRHDSITDSEKHMYAMIDSIKNVPLVKSYIEIVNIAVNGYKRIGKIDFGPYLGIYSFNNVEGNRIRLGFRTNIDFSRKWVIKAYGAYGTKDTKFKYGTTVSYIFNKKRWTEVGVEYRKDIELVAINPERLGYNPLFLTYAQWGTLRGPFYKEFAQVYFNTELRKDFGLKVKFRNWDFNAADAFDFDYYPKIYTQNDTSVTTNYFRTTELITELRLTKDEILLQNDNERMSFGTKGSWPIVALRHIYGMKGVLKSNFDYHKLYFFVSQSFRVGALGRSYYDFTAGKIFSPLPYPLLEVHIGNQSPFYSTAAYNLMNYFEFVSDQFVSLNYRHYFEGLFFNRIPLIRKLKWRFLVTANVLYGSLSQKNIDMIPYDVRMSNHTINKFGDLPYAEVGYGIENIFKIFRIDFFHRLTYNDHPNVRTFGIKFSAQFRF